MINNKDALRILAKTSVNPKELKKAQDLVKEEKALERRLNVIADFERIWSLTHSSLYTDSHYEEYEKAKAEYIEANY